MAGSEWFFGPNGLEWVSLEKFRDSSLVVNHYA